jgi:quinol monooxygenase YgiN
MGRRRPAVDIRDCRDHWLSRSQVDVELVVVTMSFDAADDDRLRPLLAKYVVMARDEPGCRNVDLLASATRPGRYLVVAKWESAAAQRGHFDRPAAMELAEGCRGLLTGPPQIDLLDAISAHDLM